MLLFVFLHRVEGPSTPSESLLSSLISTGATPLGNLITVGESSMAIASATQSHLTGVFLDDQTYTSYKIYDMVIDDGVLFGFAPWAVRGGPMSPSAVGECCCGCD